MRILIIGAGFTGTHLAKSLVAEKNTVVLIDNNPGRVRAASDQVDCSVLEADGNSLETLEKAGIAEADALVALTDDDEVNMITCSLVDAVHPRLLKIARVRNYAYYTRTAAAAARLSVRPPSSGAAGPRPIYGIDRMVNPDVEAADAIGRALDLGAVGNVVELGGGFGILTLCIAPGSPLAERPLRSLRELPGWHHLVAFVEGPDGTASLPSGGTILHAGDSVGILARSEELPTLPRFAGASALPARRVAVFGAAGIGELVAARQLERGARRRTLFGRLFGNETAQARPDFAIVDPDADRCRAAAERFPEAQVLRGDVADEALLREEGLASCDLVVAASDDHDRNLVTAAYLKSRGAGRAVALLADSTFAPIAQKLGVDVVVPVRDAVVDAIMSHLRGRHVGAVHSICGGAFEIVECGIAADAEAAGHPLREVSRAGEFLMLLLRPPGAEAWERPKADSVLAPGSQVALIMRRGDAPTLRRFCGLN